MSKWFKTQKRGLMHVYKYIKWLFCLLFRAKRIEKQIEAWHEADGK
ncbi:hypothetical protein D2M30_1353 [Bacillus amyloliquefaciens]|nr:hypothetical protein D2M30_1353 [Bacillus amyloliquefaciens]